jgi:hypothetical protein
LKTGRRNGSRDNSQLFKGGTPTDKVRFCLFADSGFHATHYNDHDPQRILCNGVFDLGEKTTAPSIGCQGGDVTEQLPVHRCRGDQPCDNEFDDDVDEEVTDSIGDDVTTHQRSLAARNTGCCGNMYAIVIAIYVGFVVLTTTDGGSVCSQCRLIRETPTAAL